MPELLKTGKYIYELESLVGNLKTDAYFVVSQDDLARKVSLRELKLALNGDDDDPSNENYYSSEKIDQLISQIYQRILNIEQDFLGLSKKFEELQSIVQNGYNELNEKIDKVNIDINNRIDEEVNNLNDRITQIYDELTERIDNLYSYGTEIPEELEEGKLYFQYFIDEDPYDDTEETTNQTESGHIGG